MDMNSTKAIMNIAVEFIYTNYPSFTNFTHDKTMKLLSISGLCTAIAAMGIVFLKKVNSQSTTPPPNVDPIPDPEKDALKEYGHRKLTYYLEGDCNIILTVPHDGHLKPNDIPDRTNGCSNTESKCTYSQTCENPKLCRATKVRDMFTLKLMESTAQKIFDITGKKPHIIVSHLARIKMDPNRDIEEATFNNVEAIKVYKDFHGFIDRAISAIIKTGKPGILFDIHGQAHKEEWIELGYLLSKSSLNANRIEPSKTSIKTLFSRHQHIDFDSMLRGVKSFGHLLEQKRHKVVPSPNFPSPNDGKYYSGGFITKQYGNDDLDAIQIENPVSLRFNEASRIEYANNLAECICEFFEEFYGSLSLKDDFNNLITETTPQKMTTAINETNTTPAKLTAVINETNTNNNTKASFANGIKSKVSLLTLCFFLMMFT